MAFVTGCSTRTVVSDPVRVVPPESLFPDCTTPEAVIETNEDLAESYEAMREALRRCREGMESIKGWDDQP